MGLVAKPWPLSDPLIASLSSLFLHWEKYTGSLVHHGGKADTQLSPLPCGILRAPHKHRASIKCRSNQLPLSKGRDLAEHLPEATEQAFPSCPHHHHHHQPGSYLHLASTKEIALIISFLELCLELVLESLEARPTCLQPQLEEG